MEITAEIDKTVIVIGIESRKEYRSAEEE